MTTTADLPQQGLTAAEAARRLESDGANELPGTRPRNLLVIAKDVLAEPMLLLLLSAASIYVVLGDAREAIAIAASMLIVVAISIVQERRTEHALARLRELSSPRALVIRDSTEQRVSGREVVRGDLVILREGDRVPADAELCSANALSVDESILTGESLPIDKAAPHQDGAAKEAGIVHSGSLVVRGFGTARVVATGERSQIGRIGKALETLTSEPTPLFKEIRRIVRWAAIGGLALCVAVAIVYAMTRGDWLGGLLAGITLAMGLMPEEFPVVLTMFLALGAWRLSKQNVLTRRMPAIETIGSVTILAVDKTGTLTENRMRVALIETDSRRSDLRRDDSLDAAGVAVLGTALAASEFEAFDPMERAIHDAARQLIPGSVAALCACRIVREYDLTPQLLAVTHVWECGDHAGMDVMVKGAPETVFRLCRLGPGESQIRLARIAEITREGLRVLAVARGRFAGGELPESPYSFDLQLLGLLCLADPLRAAVPAAIAECNSAGIRVVMITGDHPGTALAIAQQARFRDTAVALTGAEIQALDDRALRERARSVSIYARMAPEHKLRLVQAFRANGEVIAMTGDGVNDAPALKAAHVGVAMGKRGTDVAREAASLVLLEDDFASLVRAVRSGRGIYENLRHAMVFILAVHIPIAGMGLLPVVLGWPLFLLPLHVLFLEFVIDPACAFVFEADEPGTNLMRRKPRSPTARMFSAHLVRRGVAMGVVVLALTVLVYAIALRFLPPEQARALTFITLVVANLSLIFVNRAPDTSFAELLIRPNTVFWGIAAATSLLLVCTIYYSPVAAAFQFSAPPFFAFVGVLAAAVGVVLASGLLLRRSGSLDVTIA